MSAPSDPTEVLTLLSQERMSWYKKDPNSWRLLSDADALRRYEDQAALQAKTWVFIGGVEVILRNALHHALTDHYGAWHDEDSPFVRVLAAPDAKRLREARRTCEADRARHSRTLGERRHRTWPCGRCLYLRVLAQAALPQLRPHAMGTHPA